MSLVQIESVDGVECWRAPVDINGNSRYVVWWGSVVDRREYAGKTNSGIDDIFLGVEIARKRLFGSKYRGKAIGGGIIFQAPEGHKARIRQALAEMERVASEL